MAWSDNDKISIRQAAKQAKRRLLESMSKNNGLSGNISTVSKADAKFYKKVLGIMNSPETIENPIAVLAGDTLKKCADENERMKIVFDTARKFNEAKEYIEKNAITAENFDEKVLSKESNKNFYANCKILNNALYNAQHGLSYREPTFKGGRKATIFDAEAEIAALRANANTDEECTGNISRKCLNCTEECSTKDFIMALCANGRKMADIISMYSESDSIRRPIRVAAEEETLSDGKCLAEFEKRKISEIIKDYDLNVENNAQAEKLLCERAGDMLYTSEGEKALAANRQVLERCDDQSDEVLKLMVKLIQKNYDKLNKQTL